MASQMSLSSPGMLRRMAADTGTAAEIMGRSGCDNRRIQTEPYVEESSKAGAESRGRKAAMDDAVRTCHAGSATAILRSPTSR